MFSVLPNNRKAYVRDRQIHTRDRLQITHYRKMTNMRRSGGFNSGLALGLHYPKWKCLVFSELPAQPVSEKGRWMSVKLGIISETSKCKKTCILKQTKYSNLLCF